MTADGLKYVVRHAHLGQLGDDRVPQIVEPQAVEAGAIPQRPPGRVPLQHRLGRIGNSHSNVSTTDGCKGVASCSRAACR